MRRMLVGLVAGFALSIALSACTKVEAPASAPEWLRAKVHDCRAGRPLVCLEIAHALADEKVAYHDAMLARRAFDRGHALLGAACNGQSDDESCAVLGAALVEGDGVAVDRDRGLAMIRHACAGGSVIGCAWLDQRKLARCRSGTSHGTASRHAFARRAPPAYRRLRRAPRWHRTDHRDRRLVARAGAIPAAAAR